MIQFSRHRENTVNELVLELYAKSTTTGKELDMRDMIDIVNLRNNDTHIYGPVNIVDYEIIRSMIDYLAAGRVSLRPSMVYQLYLRREPELREHNIEKPEGTKLPINYSIVRYTEREMTKASNALDSYMKDKLGEVMSFTKLWRKLPVVTKTDCEYLIEHMVATIILQRNLELKDNPWYSEDTTDTNVKSNTSTKLELIGRR